MLEVDEEFWREAHVVMPPGKTSVHLRVDNDSAPRVGYKVLFAIHMGQSSVSPLAVIFALVLGFDHGIFEDQRRVAKVNAVLFEIAAPLFLIPFETVIHLE